MFECQEADEEPPTLLSLPRDVLQHVLSVLPPEGLARLECTCTALRAQAKNSTELWQMHYKSSWRSRPAVACGDAEAGRTTWQRLFAARTQMERRACTLLRCMENPAKKHKCIKELYGLGEDVVELLATQSSGEARMLLGRRYFAALALGRVVSLRCAERLRGLLARPGAEERLEEGALLLAQVHYLHSDLTPVANFLDDLGAELRRRMAAARVGDGLRALELLSELLFGRRDPKLPTYEGEPPEGWAWSEADAGQLALPRPGYGLGIAGNARNYYDATNSLLPFVLVWRRGIPISLAQLHAAVGRRAGLPVQPVAVPMHFMNKVGEPGAPDERFVDVFNLGALLTRAQTHALMGEMGVGINEGMLRPVRAADVYVRTCANLVNQQYRQGGPHIHCKLRPVLDLLLAARPGARDYLSMRAFVAERLDDFDAARADLLALVGLLPAGPVVPQRLPADVQPAWARLAARERELLASCARVSRREPERVRFRVGQVIRHAQYAYQGVITGWDTSCQSDALWIAQMGVDNLPSGRSQPFYHVLVDMRNRPCQATYVAQDNIRLLSRDAGGADAAVVDGDDDASVQHPYVGEFFDGLPPGELRYVPNGFMRERYPDDYP